MPGFNILGSEDVNKNPPSLVEVRRTHRWTFATLGTLGTLGGAARGLGAILLVLQKASRPSFNFEEPSMHHNQEQIYFAGKHTWEPVSMTWYDVEQDPDVSNAMWEWLRVCLDIDRMTVSTPSVYKAAAAKLEMEDGTGRSTDQWTLYNGWPKVLNWNALDYTSTELQLIEAQFRFDRAVHTKVF